MLTHQARVGEPFIIGLKALFLPDIYKSSFNDKP